MKRRPFVLLEVLIAFSLIALFAPLLMKLPVKLYKSQIEQLEEMERQRLADFAFSEVKEMLLKQSIPWKELPPKGVTSRRFILPDGEVNLPNFPPKSAARSFALRCSGEKEGRSREVFRLYEVCVFVGQANASYNYRIHVQKLIPSEPLSYTESG
jgi:type II secretory pathway pseudopilin PulG